MSALSDPSAAAAPPPREARGATALIVNRHARGGRAAADVAPERLRARGLDLVSISCPARAEEIPGLIAEAVAGGVDTVVVAGGDGTVSTAADRLAQRDVVLGVLPLGTANDFARTLGIPTDLAAACDVIADGVVAQIDLATVTRPGDPEPAAPEPDLREPVGRFVVNVASCGLSVATTRALSPRLKRALGPLAYPVAAVRGYLRTEPFAVRLEFPDGDHGPVELDDVLQLGVANGRFQGGGITVSPEAGLADHLLDVYAIRRAGLGQQAAVLRGLRSGRYVERAHVFHVATPAVRVITHPARQLNIDGELDGRTPRDFAVARAALRVLVPEVSRSTLLRNSRRRRGPRLGRGSRPGN